MEEYATRALEPDSIDFIAGASLRRFRCAVRKASGAVLKAFMQVPLLILDIPFFSLRRRTSQAELDRIAESVRPGDIVITADRLFPLWQCVIRAAGSNYCHAAIYEGAGRVIEATTFHDSGRGVAHTPLEKYIGGHKALCVLRPPYGGDAGVRAALGYAWAQLGKPYDVRMQVDSTDAMYCTKLVAGAMAAAGFRVPPTRFFGKPGYIPDEFMRMEGVQMVWGGAPCFGRTMLCQLPFLAAETMPAALFLSGMLDGFAAAAVMAAVPAVWILLGFVQLKTRFL